MRLVRGQVSVFLQQREGVSRRPFTQLLAPLLSRAVAEALGTRDIVKSADRGEMLHSYAREPHSVVRNVKLHEIASQSYRVPR